MLPQTPPLHGVLLSRQGTLGRNKRIEPEGHLSSQVLRQSCWSISWLGALPPEATKIMYVQEVMKLKVLGGSRDVRSYSTRVAEVPAPPLLPHRASHCIDTKGGVIPCRLAAALALGLGPAASGASSPMAAWQACDCPCPGRPAWPSAAAPGCCLACWPASRSSACISRLRGLRAALAAPVTGLRSV